MNLKTKGVVYLTLILLATLAAIVPYTGVAVVKAVTASNAVVILPINDSYMVNWTYVNLASPPNVNVYLNDTKGGSEIAVYINTTSSIFSGAAAVWIMLSNGTSTQGVEQALTSADAVYIGPILITELQSTTYQNASLAKIYSPFHPAYDKVVLNYGNVTNPKWANGTTVIVGNNIAVFRLPKEFVCNQKYTIKVITVDPTSPGVLTSPYKIAVSSNMFEVKAGVWSITSKHTNNNALPDEPITVQGYAISTAPFNITLDGTPIAPYNRTATLRPLNTPMATRTKWNVTEYYVTIKAPDLKAFWGVSKTFTVAVRRESTIVYPVTFTQPYRYVVLNATNPSINENLTKTNETLSSTFNAPGTTMNISLYNFPYMGKAYVYIIGEGMSTPINLTSVVQLGIDGNATIINIPIPANLPKSGYYHIVIWDNDYKETNMAFNFTVYIKLQPYLEIIPVAVHVGDNVTVVLHRFNDYVGQKVILQVNYPIYGLSGSWQNMTVMPFDSIIFNVTKKDGEKIWFIVPHMQGGEHGVRVVLASNLTLITNAAVTPSGKTVVANFTVYPALVVVPSSFKPGEIIFAKVIGTGFNETNRYDMVIDSHFTISSGELYGRSGCRFTRYGTTARITPSINILFQIR